MRTHHKQGITVIEVLVVLAVLAVITVIIYPVFHTNKRVHDAPPHCMSHQRQLAVSLITNAQDNDEAFTLPTDWVQATGLRSDPKVFNCPQSKKEGSPDNPEYGMNAHLYEIEPKTGERFGLPQSLLGDPYQIELTVEITGRSEGIKSEINPFSGSYTATAFIGPSSNVDWRHNSRKGWRKPKQYGINVSYCDGHVKLIKSHELTAKGRTRYSIPLGTRQKGGK